MNRIHHNRHFIFLHFSFSLFWSLPLAVQSLPFVDNVRERWQPSGDSAWLLTGNSDFESKITANDLTADGKIIALGTDDGGVIYYDLFQQRALWTNL